MKPFSPPSRGVRLDVGPQPLTYRRAQPDRTTRNGDLIRSRRTTPRRYSSPIPPVSASRQRIRGSRAASQRRPSARCLRPGHACGGPTGKTTAHVRSAPIPATRVTRSAIAVLERCSMPSISKAILHDRAVKRFSRSMRRRGWSVRLVLSEASSSSPGRPDASTRELCLTLTACRPHAASPP